MDQNTFFYPAHPQYFLSGAIYCTYSVGGQDQDVPIFPHRERKQVQDPGDRRQGGDEGGYAV